MSRWSWGTAGGAPAVVCTGVPSRSWECDDWAVWSDDILLWGRRREQVDVVHATVHSVTARCGGPCAETDRGTFRWGASGWEAGDPGERAGRDLVVHRERPGGWRAAFPLPLGARQAPDLRPWPLGEGVAWSDGGYIYTASRRGVEARAVAQKAWSVGPHGALIVGDGVHWTGAAGPGRTPTALPRGIPSSAHWCGERLRLVREDGSTELVDPATGSTAPGPGPTVDVLGARPARGGTLLAGPGGAVWDLLRAERSFELPPGPALLVAGPLGVLWMGSVARWFAADGTLLGECPLPHLHDKADRLDLGAGHADGFHVWSGLGQGFALTPALRWTEQTAARPRRPRLRATTIAGVSLRLAGDEQVGPHRWGWTARGWLAILPSDQRAIS